MALCWNKWAKCAAMVVAMVVGGCGHKDPGKTTLTLDWKPEPEFGGFYAAQADGDFARHGIDLQINAAGDGSTWQMVDTGKTDFATTAADQVMIARSQGADVVAFFAVYQTCPQAIMVHRSRGFTSLADVFSHDGTLFAEKISWLDFVRAKYPNGRVTIGQYDSSAGIVPFLSNEKNAQQCFVTSEPILARQKGADPQTFLVAESGYNPYTTVVICRGDLWRKNPQRVRDMSAACQQGWRAYLDHPEAANRMMGEMNKEMDASTFAAAAEEQKPLIETDETRSHALGSMTEQRWTDLGKQLVQLGVIKTAPVAKDCFVNP